MQGTSASYIPYHLEQQQLLPSALQDWVPQCQASCVGQRKRSRWPDRASETVQGGYPGQGGAFALGYQTLVRICQGELLLLEEEHGPTLHAVCAVQPVDGARQIVGCTRMSVPGNRATTPHRSKKRPSYQQKPRNFGRLLMNLHHLKNNNSLLQFTVSYSEHP